MINYIQHHGIEGQQWGVRNGPPYPLDKKVKKLIRPNAQQRKEARTEAGEYFKKRIIPAPVISAALGGGAATALVALGVFAPASIPLSILASSAFATAKTVVNTDKIYLNNLKMSEIENYNNLVRQGSKIVHQNMQVI